MNELFPGKGRSDYLGGGGGYKAEDVLGIENVCQDILLGMTLTPTRVSISFLGLISETHPDAVSMVGRWTVGI